LGHDIDISGGPVDHVEQLPRRASNDHDACPLAVRREQFAYGAECLNCGLAVELGVCHGHKRLILLVY